MTYLGLHTERQIIRDLAGFVATELAARGYPYHVDTDPALAEHRMVYLQQKDNAARIALSLVMGNNDRVDIRGVYPRNRVYDLPRVSATVARDRGPKAVADAIIKRIHPEYLPALAKVHESNAEDVTCAKARADLVERLGMADGQVDNGETRATFRLRVNGAWGDAHVSYRADSVELHLRDLTPEQALAIARILKES